MDVFDAIHTRRSIRRYRAELAAHARGLGFCWVGAPMPWLKSEGVAVELGWPEGYDPVAAIILGHPAEQPAGQPKPPPEVRWL